VPNLEMLRNCFVESLDLPEGVDVETLVYRGVQQWDSLSHMHLISELERRFDIMVDTEDVLDMSSFEKAVEILGKYGIDLSN